MKDAIATRLRTIMEIAHGIPNYDASELERLHRLRCAELEERVRHSRWLLSTLPAVPQADGHP